MPAPNAPSNVILQTGNGKNLISWGIVSGATSYQVQRSIDGVNFTNLFAPTVNYYVDSTAVVGTNYYYQVDAINGSGSSAYVASYPPLITPCLPGQINLGYLRYMAQLESDQINAEFLSDDEWNSNINRSADELYDILVTKYGDNYFFAPPLIINTSGLQSYPLPDGSNYPIAGINSPALYKLSGVDYNAGGTGAGTNALWVPCARFNWSDRNKYSLYGNGFGVGTFAGFVVPSYREMGNQLFVIPYSSGQPLQLWYVPIRQQMLLDTDMMPFSISGWAEYVIVDAAIKAARKEESFDLVNELKGDKAALLERIETTAANRDVDQPNSVSNTRQSMGDPGFGGFGGGSFGGNGGWFL